MLKCPNVSLEDEWHPTVSVGGLEIELYRKGSGLVQSCGETCMCIDLLSLAFLYISWIEGMIALMSVVSRPFLLAKRY